MSDEPALPFCVSTSRRAPEERLAHRPELLARLHHLLDTLDQSVADGADANSAGKSWATGRAKPTTNSRRRCAVNIPKPSNTVKKLLKWQTTFGWITVEEVQWRWAGAAKRGVRFARGRAWSHLRWHTLAPGGSNRTTPERARRGCPLVREKSRAAIGM